MKKNIIIAVSAVLLGLLLGYFIFGYIGNSSEHGEHEKVTVETEEQIWTCSMHPQIRRPEPGDCPICGMDLIILEEKSNTNPLVFEMTEEAVKISNIQTTIIGGVKTTTNSLRLSGKIMANESTSASVASHIPGRIEKLFINFTGEKVRKGQKIATIYAPKLITAQKELLEAYKMKEVNPKLFEAALNKLKFWKITDEQIDEILATKTVKQSIYIYSDYTGVVTTKRVSVGDHLMEGSVLFDIQNLNKLWVLFDVYEEDLQTINLGDEIEFSTPSVSGEVFTARISFIDPLINPKTRSATVRVEISNSKQLLKPEMFVTGYLTLKKGSETKLMVPKTAVLWTGERSVVYVRVRDLTIPSFEFHEVVLGESIGGSYVVVEGLESGDEVVTNGAFVIDASAQLNNQNSMMNRNVIIGHSKKDEGDDGAEGDAEEMKCDGSMDMNKQDQEMKCEPGKCGDGM